MKLKIIATLSILFCLLVFAPPASPGTYDGTVGSAVIYPKFRAFTADGLPLAGGHVHTYAPATTTAQTTYTDQLCTTAAANPIVLDANGEAEFYTLKRVKLVIENSAGVVQNTVDNFIGTGRNYSTSVLTANSTTPSVASRDYVYVTANTNSTTITNFTNGAVGQSFSLLINDAVTAFNFTTGNLKGNSGENYTASPGDVMYCVADSSNWRCLVEKATPPPRGSIGDIYIAPNAATPHTKLDITDTAGTETLDTAGVGANGLDTGSLEASTLYYVFKIHNATTRAYLLSKSKTAPVMPTGYVHRQLISGWKTDGDTYFVLARQSGIRVLMDVPATIQALSGSAEFAFTDKDLSGQLPAGLARAALVSCVISAPANSPHNMAVRMLGSASTAGTTCASTATTGKSTGKAWVTVSAEGHIAWNLTADAATGNSDGSLLLDGWELNL